MKLLKNMVEYNEWNRILTGIVLLDREYVGEAICGLPVVAGREFFWTM